MRVLQINAVPNGSTGKLAMELHKKASEANIESYFIYTSGSADAFGTIKIGSKCDQRIHSFLSRLTGLQGYFSVFQTKKIISEIARLKPDIVHLHNLHANNINLKMLFNYLAKQGISVCVSLHDCFYFTGHCCYYTDIDCGSWKIECGNCPQMKKYNKSWFFDTSKRALRDKQKYFNMLNRYAVVGVSKWISDEAKHSILKTATINTHVYNWVNSEIFYPKKCCKPSFAEGKFMIIGVSQWWSDYKGIDDFISLAKRLSDDEVIVLVGNCTRELPDNIINIPHTQNAEHLAELYSAADVFVSLSKQETFGLVTAEALSCGTPAVVYNNTASPELIGEGCGYVCRNGDIEDVLRAVQTVKENGKELYSDNCLSFAEKHFDLNRNVKQYYEIYEKLIGG